MSVKQTPISNAIERLIKSVPDLIQDFEFTHPEELWEYIDGIDYMQDIADQQAPNQKAVMRFGDELMIVLLNDGKVRYIGFHILEFVESESLNKAFEEQTNTQAKA